MNDDLPQFMSPPEIARLLRVKPERVRSWIVNGSLDAVNLSDGRQVRYRVSRSSLEAFLKSREVVQAPPPPRRRTKAPAEIEEFY